MSNKKKSSIKYTGTDSVIHLVASFVDCLIASDIMIPLYTLNFLHAEGVTRTTSKSQS